MPTNEEISQIFPEMQSRFQPEKADGVDATIQFNLTGDNGGMYWIKIADGTCEYGEGTLDDPSMTMTTSADDFHGVVHGTVNPMQAFMMGKIKVSDVGLAMKMMQMFNMG